MTDDMIYLINLISRFVAVAITAGFLVWHHEKNTTASAIECEQIDETYKDGGCTR
jgi:hypothetical protein